MTIFKSFIVALLFTTITSSAELDIVGKEAPNFNLTDLINNKTVSLNQFKGKVVVLDFWASWCAPCKKTLPLLKSIAKEYKTKIFVITINIDEEKKNAESFIKRFQLELPVLHDFEQSVVEKYKIPEMPTLFIIDKSGVIQFVHIGYSEDYKEKLVNAINKLL